MDSSVWRAKYQDRIMKCATKTVPKSRGNRTVSKVRVDMLLDGKKKTHNANDDCLRTEICWLKLQQGGAQVANTWISVTSSAFQQKWHQEFQIHWDTDATREALGNAVVSLQQLNYKNRWSIQIALQVNWIRFKMELNTGFANFTEILLDYLKWCSNKLSLCFWKHRWISLSQGYDVKYNRRYKQHRLNFHQSWTSW